MKFKSFSLLCILVLSIGLSANLYAQKQTEVEKVLENPGEFVNEFATLEGFITQYTPANASTTANYLIKGAYGGIMKINTSGDQPKINEKYRVSGTIIIDPYSGNPYMVEKNRISLTVVPPAPPKQEESNLLMYLMFGFLGIIILILILVLVLKRKKAVPDSNIRSTGPKAPEPQPFSTSEPEYNNEFKTVKIVTQQAPKTMVYIPGKLEIMNGNDAGKQFMLAAYPAPGGPTVTIGSREETGERKYSHIRLLEKTVSRAQAEIIYKDKKIYIKNLSQTNYTQVDGSELRPDEISEVKPGSKIRVGEVVFQYLN